VSAAVFTTDVFFCLRKEDESRHRGKHKKVKKVKEEPIDEEEDNAIPTIKSER